MGPEYFASYVTHGARQIMALPVEFKMESATRMS
jgi:hypothetical protein